MTEQGQPHRQSIAEVLAGHSTSPAGLSEAEAAARRALHGPNELIEKKKRGLLSMFLDQFKDYMILVLIAAAVISGVLGDPEDAVAIAVIVVLNAALGFSQEYRAEKAMAALKKLAAASATVLRGGTATTIPASDLVPGDVVILQAGDVVPADLRLIEAARFTVEEAALTGESVPVEKQTSALPGADRALGDRKNMAYKGTFATYGRATAVVVATGMKTELGHIAAMLQDGDEVKTPLQKRMTAFGKTLTFAILAICAVVFVAGVIRGEPALLMMLTAISLAVAAIPEALPAIITISLALGAQKLAKLNALIRKLPAVETLGSVTYICSDKTGTLTLNKMTVEEAWVDGDLVRAAEFAAPSQRASEARTLFFRALALSNDARAGADGGILGDPTEVALFQAARTSGFDKTELEREFPRVAELPFDSDRKLMTTFHRRGDGKIISLTKGAMENVLERSRKVLTSRGESDLDLQTMQQVTDRIAGDGLRALGFAFRFWDALPEILTSQHVETDLVLLGLVGMMDPPRPQAREAVALCRAAGIQTVMITGDHPLTARAIAKRIGIVADGDGPRSVMTGRELEELPLEEFQERVDHVRVYARVAPEQKLKIVKALQNRGQFVAMTGDGVNDAPALKRADIGVAMGISGTEVSKEAASMILLDDSFITIVKSVKEGRRIFDNIRKFIKFAMTGNSGEIWTIFLAPFLGLPIPLLPIHILWVNLVTDGLPGLALAAEPADADIMNRPARHPQESIFAHGLGFHIVWVGLFIAAVAIITQAWSMTTGRANWQTMVFTVLCLSQMAHVLAIRSDRESLFTQGLLTNKPLLGATLFTFILQLATIYVPFLNPIFKTKPLSLNELALTLVLSSSVFAAVEMEKYFKRRGRLSNES